MFLVQIKHRLLHYFTGKHGFYSEYIAYSDSY